MGSTCRIRTATYGPFLRLTDRIPVSPFFVDKKWMDELGLKEPTSLDELYTVLKAFKDNDVNGNGDKNDEIPFTANAGVTIDLLLPYFNLNYDHGTRTAIDGDKVVYVPTSYKPLILIKSS